MKKILEHLQQNWIRYGFESIAILISILAAFALNNWNENRKERKLESKYLASLSIDLENDLEYLKALKLNRQTINKTAFKLLSTDKIPATYDAQHQFTVDFINVHFWYEFVPNDNTFKELSNSGNLSLFQNDSIKIGLLNLESLNDELISARDHMRREYDKYLYDELVKFDEFALLDFEHMVSVGKMDIRFIDNLDEETLTRLTIEANDMLKNQKIRNGWKLAILNNAYILEIYDKMTTQIRSIQSEIKK